MIQAQFAPTQPHKTLKYLANIPLLGVILIRSQCLSWLSSETLRKWRTVLLRISSFILMPNNITKIQTQSPNTQTKNNSGRTGQQVPYSYNDNTIFWLKIPNHYVHHILASTADYWLNLQRAGKTLWPESSQVPGVNDKYLQSPVKTLKPQTNSKPTFSE